MTVVANAAGVCGGLPGCCCGASDGVPGSGLCDAGVLCLLASETGQETWLSTGGGCRSGGCASAGHDVLSVVDVFESVCL